jgi:hypothetical protein
MMKIHPLMLAVILATPVCVHAEEVEEGTRIIGTEESPAVLNVVPWQARELGGNPANGSRQFKSVLDDALKPVDRGELQREIDYFNLLQKQQNSNKTKQ